MRSPLNQSRQAMNLRAADFVNFAEAQDCESSANPEACNLCARNNLGDSCAAKSTSAFDTNNAKQLRLHQLLTSDLHIQNFVNFQLRNDPAKLSLKILLRKSNHLMAFLR